MSERFALDAPVEVVCDVTAASREPAWLQQVTAESEQIQYDAVDREKSLRVRSGCEPTHQSLAMLRWLVRDLRPIVVVLPGAVNRRHDRAVRRLRDYNSRGKVQNVLGDSSAAIRDPL